MDAKWRRRTVMKKKKQKAKESILRKSSEIEGIRKVRLSPLTQRILECQIGRNITAEEPWKFVKKEDILDNIILHELSSEFLAIKDDIENYTEDEILIGSYGHEQDIPVVFMVCTSQEAAKITLAAREAEKTERTIRVAESLFKVCQSWQTLGSEIEIDENNIHSNRNLYQVQLTLETAWFYVKCKFNERLAEDSPNGYVELISKQNFVNVYRKLLDSNAQCAAIKTNAMVQVDIEPVFHRGTQPMCFQVHFVDKLAKTNALDENYIFHQLQTNSYMDMCKEDYNFINALHMNIFTFPLCVITFQDIFTCRGKKVSDVSWNALKSGLIAVAYVEYPSPLILTINTPLNTMETIFEDHLVLVWTYQDITKPQLYLHSIREVTTVSFCSYNANIVIGGCQNGQIVVWDISGRLERTEKLKVLTRKQLDNHLIIEKYMKWMKRPPEFQHVYPILVTNITESHQCPVSYIEWLPPDQYITKNGEFKKSKSKDCYMQFLSCGTEDGCISIWDIGLPEDAKIETKTKHSIRLNETPAALTKYVSPLKALKSLMPVFRIFLSNPVNNNPLIISKLLATQGDINYKALNPETAGEIYKRTYFQHILEEERTIKEQEFICATAVGELYSIHWEYYEYDPGCRINSKPAIVNQTKTYHDGPIIVCMENPVIKDLILTIGGRVFAIWNVKNLQAPIFWRKTAHRYVAGSWLSSHPFQIGLVRYDTYKEIWDMMNDSKNALKVIRWKGRATLGVFNDLKVNHVKKSTYVETNIAGEVNVFFAPDSFQVITGEELEAVINYIHDMELHKIILGNWINTIKAKLAQETEEIAEETVDVAPTAQQSRQTIVAHPVSERKKSIGIINKWQAKEEANMRRILLEKKNVNMKTIKMNTALVREEKEQRRAKIEKFLEKLKQRDKTMQNWKVILIPETQYIAKHTITVNFPKDICQYMKQSYIENYECIEEQVVDYIRCHKYHFVYNWAESSKRAKDLHNLITT